MTKKLYWCIAIMVIVAPILHVVSDVIEWINQGFSPTQLIINYAGFLLMPFLMIGLYAVQFPKINLFGLIGSVIYGIAFIYFAYTSLYALEESIPNYEILWSQLGFVYTFHGGLMILGGLLFGFSSLRAGILWQKGLILFIAGLIFNLLLAFLPIPEIFQTIGSAIRNIGMIGIGFGMIRSGISSTLF